MLLNAAQQALSVLRVIYFLKTSNRHRGSVKYSFVGCFACFSHFFVHQYLSLAGYFPIDVSCFLTGSKIETILAACLFRLAADNKKNKVPKTRNEIIARTNTHMAVPSFPARIWNGQQPETGHIKILTDKNSTGSVLTVWPYPKSSRNRPIIRWDFGSEVIAFLTVFCNPSQTAHLTLASSDRPVTQRAKRDCLDEANGNACDGALCLIIPCAIVFRCRRTIFILSCFDIRLLRAVRVKGS